MGSIERPSGGGLRHLAGRRRPGGRRRARRGAISRGSQWAARRIPLALDVPGDYNVLNATAVFLAATAGVGASPEGVLAGLAGFAGTRRRLFESIGRVGGIEVVDDYAHNPAKVDAVVSTGRRLAGTGRLVVVFQPHLYSRTRDFAADFGQALSPADLLVVMDVYAAREDPIPGVDSGLVVRATRAARSGVDVRTAAGGAQVLDMLVGVLRPGDFVLTVGAGDVTTVGPELVRRLDERTVTP